MAVPTVIYTDSAGETRSIETPAGESVMETAVKNGVPGIVGECGGSLSCATCHVLVDDADLAGLAPMSEMEDEMLYGTASPREENSRLGCQLRLAVGDVLHVTTPETQL